MTLPRVGVVLDFGAATPMGILAAARGLCEVVFLGDPSLPYVARMAGELAGLGEVQDLGRFAALRLDGVTTFSEAQIRRTAQLADGGGFAYPRPSVAAAVTDKYLQRRMLASAGLPVPRCRVVGDPGDLAGAVRAVGLPAVLKPRQGAGSAHTCKVDSLAEAERRLREPGAAAGPFVLEEYLVGDSSVAGPRFGDYVSVESVLVGGTLRHVEVTGKFPLAPPFRETGYVVPSTLAPGARRAVLETAGAALHALGVTDGVTHVEVKLTPAGPRVIEVNGRLGGYVADLVRQARRVDLIRLALAAAIGRDLEIPAPAYRRYAFQYFLTAPMEATVLRGLSGVDELARQRGIGHVEVFRRAGDRLDWRRGTLDYLGIVHGWAADHDGVLGLIDTTVRLLAVDVA